MQHLSVEIPGLVRRGFAAPDRHMGGGAGPAPRRDAGSLEDEWHKHAEGSRRNGIIHILWTKCG